MTPAQRAEALIARYGIRDPKDIDLEAIALDVGVEVDYQDLDGCDATLVGYADRAIATIRPSPYRGRERFSLGHELGHWDMHRGRSFRCRVDEPDSNLASNQEQEKEADTYSAHLLMPAPLFQPAVKTLGTPGFRELSDLAERFETGLIAASIRLVDIDTLPVLLACYTRERRRWFARANHVPKRWWLRNNLDADSFAYDLLTAGKPPVGKKQSAEVWFENDDADNYEVLEYCAPNRNGEVLVLIYLATDMMDAGFDPYVGNRRPDQYGSYVPRKTR